MDRWTIRQLSPIDSLQLIRDRSAGITSREDMRETHDQFTRTIVVVFRPIQTSVSPMPEERTSASEKQGAHIRIVRLKQPPHERYSAAVNKSIMECGIGNTSGVRLKTLSLRWALFAFHRHCMTVSEQNSGKRAKGARRACQPSGRHLEDPFTGVCQPIENTSKWQM